MSKLHELGTGWTVEGNTATRGDVTITHYDSPHVYRAKICAPIMGTIAASEYTPIAARDALRGRIAHEFAKYDKLATFLADALAAIDAPAAPETECECKTAVMLASYECTYYKEELWQCEWVCKNVWIEGAKGKRMLDATECPNEFFPENCNGQTDAVIQWFLNDDFDEVTA